MGLLDLAVEDFRAATALDPACREAWSGLAAALRRQGERSEAADARGRAASCPPVASRRTKPTAGNPQKSRRKLQEQIARTAWRDPDDLLREHLVANPSDTGALHLLALREVEAGDLETARALLARALDLCPTYLEAREALAGLLLRMRLEAEALPHIDRMLAERPANEAYRRYKIAALSALGDFAEAARIGDALTRGNRRPGFWLNHARALRFSGRRDESAEAYRRCLALQPGSGEAYWGLSYVQRTPFSDADLAAMRAQLESGAPTPVDRFHLHYALGNALEKRRDYAASFAHYAAGARACRHANEQEGDVYRASEHAALITRLRQAFTPAFFAAAPRHVLPPPTPIFIIGMPRSGSTLIEQILSAHSQVEATQELPELDRIAREMAMEAAACGDDYPECVVTLEAHEVEALAQRYLERTRIYRKTGKPYFVDKMPFNWEKTGLIRLLFPAAKIIDARRHPVACCFSAFKQLIARGAGYSCDLSDIGLYYRDYLTFMAHIDRVCPGLVHRVIYERMVDDTEGEIRRLLAYCGLEFEPACLRFWETSRAVATPSVEQVRQPIFRDALAQWQPYEPWLQPLLEALGDAPATYAAPP